MAGRRQALFGVGRVVDPSGMLRGSGGKAPIDQARPGALVAASLLAQRAGGVARSVVAAVESTSLLQDRAEGRDYEDLRGDARPRRQAEGSALSLIHI